MNSVSLPVDEFWFYRVYSELTLSLLHQVNNELTGAVFLTEIILDDFKTGASDGEKPRELYVTIEKLIQLTKQMMEAHLPVQAEMEEATCRLPTLLEDGLPMLRLILPKTIAIRMQPYPEDFPLVPIHRKAFGLVLAAVGMLMPPQSARLIGEVVVQAESAPPSLTFFPSYPVAEPDDELQREQCPGWLALTLRAKRLGGGLVRCHHPLDAGRQGIRLLLPSTSHE